MVTSNSPRGRRGVGLVGAALVFAACYGEEVESRSFGPQDDWQSWLTAGLDPDQSLLVSGATALACQERLALHCAEQQGELSSPQRVAEIHTVDPIGFLCAAGCTTQDQPQVQNALAQQSNTGLRGWNILQPSYRRFHLLDGLSLEWDYFMVHDKHGNFTGSIGYLLADPRGRLDGFGGLPGLVPSGMNTAIAGSFAGAAQTAEFMNFNLAQSAFSASERSTSARKGVNYARMVPVPAAGDTPDHLLLQGRTDRFQWELTVRQDWSERGGFEATRGDDLGFLPGENWTVEMVWPRTVVTGEITNLVTGETVQIDGHGYRENSWGRWAFVAGGWDFGIVSDEESGVQWAWQTYHPKSKELDFVDVTFPENGEIVKRRFDQKQIGWHHAAWRYDQDASQCVPLTGRVVAADADYWVEVDILVNDDQVAMLSDITPITRIYFIMIQFPWFEGRIENRHTGAVTHFGGRGGGEFSLMRSLIPQNQASCDALFKDIFARPMPTP